MSGGLFSGLGDLAGGIFGFLGQEQVASMYSKAASIAGQNVGIAKESTAVQEQQTEIGIEKTLGAQTAAVGASGFAASGSAEDLLRSSAAQGSLAKSLVAQQGLINQNSYKEQQYAFKAEAAAAQMGGAGALAGGILGAAGSFLGL